MPPYIEFTSKRRVRYRQEVDCGHSCCPGVLQTRMMMTSLLPSALHCQLLPVPQQQQLMSAAPAAWQGMPAQCPSARGVQQQEEHYEAAST